MIPDARRPRGRYAPSPTGSLHLGNASTALLAWLSIRSKNGTFILRMEDLDAGRSRPEAARSVLEDLAWLGLDWDEGPDRGGPHAPYVQSERRERYDAAFARLRDAGKVYPCFCSRKDIASAASAPQVPGDEAPYPGTCRRLDAAEVRERLAAGRSPAWRFRASGRFPDGLEDLARGSWRPPDGWEPGDFVVRRQDGGAAYQLAVVVDDAAMEISEVVRGDDLLPSTIRQLLLYEALGLRAPRFGHVPLLLGPDGVRLSKRHPGLSIEALRRDGWSAARLVGRIAERVGLRRDATAVEARALVPEFDWERVPPAPSGIPA